jgi:enoyl-[acyl-carrier protein] reductase I
MSFLDLKGKTYLVLGVANKKSVACFTARLLIEEGANVLLSVKSEDMVDQVSRLLPESTVFVCDVEKDDDMAALAENIAKDHPVLNGMVHSIAFADFSEGLKPFYETDKQDFLRAFDISCRSLTALSNHLKDLFDKNASVVTISISTTRMAVENYGCMSPIKAALESSICCLAKAFSRFSNVRFNSVNPGLLKTSASAGIPGYIDSYLYAEKVTLRKAAVKTDEVANTIAFLLSDRASGINATGIVIDAGMAINYFDSDIVQKISRES